MSATVRSARWRAGLLVYAAIQFVVLTTIAMALFPGGYRFLGNFLSELGATRTWAGHPNLPAMILFSLALATIGGAFMAFSGTWRAFACTRKIVRVAGTIAQVFAILSGLAFVAVACTPVNVALDLHNTLVVVAFGLLLLYAITMTIVWACNGASGWLLVASGTYLSLVIAYVAVAILAVREGIGTQRAHAMLVVSQKIFVYVSMLYIVGVATGVRRLLARS